MFDLQMEKKKKWKGEKCVCLLHPLEFTPAEGGGACDNERSSNGCPSPCLEPCDKQQPSAVRA